MIIDAHVHLCPKGILEKTYTKGIMPAHGLVSNNPYDDYVLLAKERGISKAIVFPMPLLEMKRKDKDPYVIEAYRKYPDFFVPLVLIDTGLQEIQKYTDEIAGVKEHILITNGSDMEERFPIYEWMVEKNLFLTIHPEKYKESETVKKISSNFPKLKIILAHSGRNKTMTGNGMYENALELKTYSNIFFDTSNIREPDKLFQFINIVGSQRVFFGSDYPFGAKDIYTEEFKTVINMPVSSEIKENILFNNVFQTIVAPFEKKQKIASHSKFTLPMQEVMIKNRVESIQRG